MSCVPHSTHPVCDRVATSSTHTLEIRDRFGRMVLFLTAPFLVFAYYTAVMVLKHAGRGDQ
ncbi:hypothetical protein [Frigoriglobus tundricola]|uniref:hypothetical protein n=1 Tax=Frigoriglobus tundricola TaxID=2774151 RepID=UPI00148ECE9B|nr:hypothetical protein [Frigoriglobus tundricola]